MPRTLWSCSQAVPGAAGVETSNSCAPFWVKAGRFWDRDAPSESPRAFTAPAPGGLLVGGICELLWGPSVTHTHKFWI